MWLLVVVALVLGPGFEWTAWVLVSENENGTFYVDRASIRRDGCGRWFWELVNLKKPDKDDDRSYRMLKEVGCEGWRYRYLKGSFYRRPMALGETSGSFSMPTDWSHVAPGSTCEVIVRFVCADESTPAHRHAGCL